MDATSIYAEMIFVSPIYAFTNSHVSKPPSGLEPHDSYKYRSELKYLFVKVTNLIPVEYCFNNKFQTMLLVYFTDSYHILLVLVCINMRLFAYILSTNKTKAK